MLEGEGEDSGKVAGVSSSLQPNSNGLQPTSDGLQLKLIAQHNRMLYWYQSVLCCTQSVGSIHFFILM